MSLYRTAAQNKRIHQLINQINMSQEHKEELVLAFTDGRTCKTSLMSKNEAAGMITWLEKQTGDGTPAITGTDAEKANTMRRKILAICHTMGWYGRNGDGTLILHEGKPILDFARINAFCLERGNAHKTLQQYSVKELPTLVTIFQKLAQSV